MRIVPLFVLSAACTSYYGPVPSPLESATGVETERAESCAGPQVTVIGMAAAMTPGPESIQPGATGNASIHVESGDHILVLSTSERTHWTVTVAPGATVTSVHLIGEYLNTVDLEVPAPVSTAIGERGDEVAFGWSLPSELTDTEKLIDLAGELAGAKVTAFHGCVVATTWTVRADGSATGNCHIYPAQDDVFFGCDGGPEPTGETFADWRPLEFYDASVGGCDGARYVRYDDRYDLYVGAILCDESGTTYKLLVSEDSTGFYYDLNDLSGRGEDHCELVARTFALPDPADITSGCTACTLGEAVDLTTPSYARAGLGEPFVFELSPAGKTSRRYSCGVAIP